MKKIRQILTGVLLIMALSVFTACGNNDMAADEVDTTNEKNNNDNKNNADNNASENEKMTDDAAIDNGDTVSEGTEGVGTTDNKTDGTTVEDGSVSQDLGDGVRAVGDGVGDAVEDVGNAVGDVVDGRE